MSAKPWWNGKHVRVVYPENFKPWVLPYRNDEGVVRLHGIYGSMMGNLTASMNMTYEAMTSDDGQYGLFNPDGTFTGMLDMVYSGRADLAGPFTPHIEIFKSGIHLTPAYHRVKTQILSGMKDAFITKSTPYTRAFDDTTWFALWGSFAVLTMLIVLEEWLVLGRRINVVMILENVFILMQTWLQEATKKRFNYGYTQIIGAVWILTTFVLMQFFTCDLKANSVVKSPTLRLNNIHDVIEHRKTYRMIFPEKSPIHFELLSFAGETGKIFRTMLDDGYGVAAQNIYDEEWIDMVRNSKAVLFMDQKSIKFEISRRCVTGKHFYYFKGDSFRWLPACLVSGPHMGKEFAAEIDRRVLWILALGVPFVRTSEVIPGNLECIAASSNKRASTITSLTYSDVEFSFTSQIYSLAVCSIALLIELFHYHCLSRGASRKIRFFTR